MFPSYMLLGMFQWLAGWVFNICATVHASSAIRPEALLSILRRATQRSGTQQQDIRLLLNKALKTRIAGLHLVMTVSCRFGSHLSTKGTSPTFFIIIITYL
jgi:hypothetical protein